MRIVFIGFRCTGKSIISNKLSKVLNFNRISTDEEIEKKVGPINEHVKEYAGMIRKAEPMFVEIKGFMSVGFARERLGYERMPTNEEMLEFVKKLVKELSGDWKLLDSHERSRAYVVGKDKDVLKIDQS